MYFETLTRVNKGCFDLGGYVTIPLLVLLLYKNLYKR